MKYKNLDGNEGVYFSFPYDTVKVFKRSGWSDEKLMFAWNGEDERMMYCKVDKGVIVFLHSYVGDGVLDSTDIVEINWRKDMTKTINVCNATVTFEEKKAVIKPKEIKWYGLFYNINDELVDSMMLVNKKDAKYHLKRMDDAVSVELYRKAVKLSIEVPIIEEEL